MDPSNESSAAHTGNGSATQAVYSRRLVAHGGVKSVLLEIGIVVLRLMLGLAASEAMQSFSWREKARNGERLLRRQVQDVYFLLLEQVTIRPCVEIRLEALSDALVTSGKRWTPVASRPAPGRVAMPPIPSRPIPWSVYPALVADGTVAHFSDSRRLLYEYLDVELQNLTEFMRQTDVSRGEIAVLMEPLELDPGVRRDQLIALYNQGVRSGLSATISEQVMREIDKAGLAPNAEQVAAIRKEIDTSLANAGCPPSA